MYDGRETVTGDSRTDEIDPDWNCHLYEQTWLKVCMEIPRLWTVRYTHFWLESESDILQSVAAMFLCTHEIVKLDTKTKTAFWRAFFPLSMLPEIVSSAIFTDIFHSALYSRLSERPYRKVILPSTFAARGDFQCA